MHIYRPEVHLSACVNVDRESVYMTSSHLEYVIAQLTNLQKKNKNKNKQTNKRQKHILNIYCAQLLNRNFTRLGSRLYSPNLKDVATLEDTQFIFDVPFICL